METVARRLGTTKGSFYWHFADRDDLLLAVLALWEDRETTQILAAIEALPDPRERLLALGRGAYARASRGGSHAALLAAVEDPWVAPVLARVTRTRLRFLERLYGGLGLDLDSAHRYARLAYAVYLGTADLRRAEQDEEVEDEEIERRAQLYVAAVVPPAEGAPAC